MHERTEYYCSAALRLELLQHNANAKC